MYLRVYLLILICGLIQTAHGQKSLLLEDKTYEPGIRTVQCYPPQSSDRSEIMPAVTSVEAQNLVVEFDDLQEQKSNYYVKVIHCNFDWTKSTLMDLDFMHDYNEFQINDYSFSINTHIPYVHYRFQVPRLKLPGNYVVTVYRDGNRNDLILSKRIMVFASGLDLVRDDEIAGLGNIRSTNQALNFILNYGRMEIVNPLGSVHVTLRQNQRWDNARQDVKPSFVREEVNQLEYRVFDIDKTFQGGNEFRFVDFRSLNYPGQNTARLDKTHKPFDLYVAMDAPRGDQPYSQYPDMDGTYYVDNLDYQQEPWISAQYLNVNFALKSPLLNNDVYVIGGFNGWARDKQNKLVFNQGLYSQRLLLKQGFYNYQYWVDTADGESNQVEGNYFQTENIYEVFVYYRAFQPNADLLIGYFVVPLNAR